MPRSSERTAFSPVNQQNNYTGLSPLPGHMQSTSQPDGYNQGRQHMSYTNYYNRPLPERPVDSHGRNSRGSTTPERPVTRNSGTPERPVTRASSGTPERSIRSVGTPERPIRNAGTPERLNRNSGTSERPVHNTGTPERPPTRGYVAPDRQTSQSQLHSRNTPDRSSYNQYGQSPYQTPVKQNFDNANNRFNPQEKFSPSVRNTGVSTKPNTSNHSGRNMAPDRQRNTLPTSYTPSSVYNHSYGTQDAIKQLYSSPKGSQGMYATQDSIRRMYNSSNTNYRQGPPSLRAQNHHHQSVSLTYVQYRSDWLLKYHEKQSVNYNNVHCTIY